MIEAMNALKKSASKQTLALFDFDGTITDRDTLIYFLLDAVGPMRAVQGLLRRLPLLLAYVIGRASRQEAKEGVLTQFFAGIPMETLERFGEHFAKGSLNKRVKPEALKRLQWHLRQGHRCILVSASIDIYLKPWGEAAGFHDVVCSRVASDAEGRATGKLLGLNCRAGEKVRRLEELLGPLKNYCVYAYGDSDGDKEMLAAADHPFYRIMQNSL